MKRRQSFTSNCNSSINSQLNQLHRPRKININRIQVLCSLFIAFLLLTSPQSIGVESAVVSSSANISTITTVENVTNSTAEPSLSPTIIANSTEIATDSLVVGEDLLAIYSPIEITDYINLECISNKKITWNELEDETTATQAKFKLTVPELEFQTIETSEGIFHRICPGIIDRRYMRQGDDYAYQPEVPLYSFIVAVPIGGEIENVIIEKQKDANGNDDRGTTYTDIRLYPVQPSSKYKLPPPYIIKDIGIPEPPVVLPIPLPIALTAVETTPIYQEQYSVDDDTILPILNPSLSLNLSEFLSLQKKFMFDEEIYTDQLYKVGDSFQSVIVQKFRNNIQKVSLNIMDYNPELKELTAYDNLIITVSFSSPDDDIIYRIKPDTDSEPPSVDRSPVEKLLSHSLPNYNIYANIEFTFFDPAFVFVPTPGIPPIDPVLDVINPVPDVINPVPDVISPESVVMQANEPFGLPANTTVAIGNSIDNLSTNDIPTKKSALGVQSEAPIHKSAMADLGDLNFNTSARLLIIYPPCFKQAAEKLKGHKNDKSIITTEIISTDDIYKEYSESVPVGSILCNGDEKVTDVQVKTYIKSYFSAKHSLWAVLLLGDSQHIPTHYHGTTAAGDIYYGQFTDDAADPPGEMNTLLTSLPVVPVGRLPVSTDSEADALINKIINYEIQYKPGGIENGVESFPATFSFVTSGLLDPDSQEIINKIKGKILDKQFEIHPPDDSNQDDGEIDMSSCINKGTFLCHRGIAGIDGWHTPEEFLTPVETGEEAVLPVGAHNPFVVSASSDSGWFDEESYQLPEGSIETPSPWCEEFLLQNGTGAIGILAPSRATTEADNNNFMGGIFDMLFPDEGATDTTQGNMLLGGIKGIIDAPYTPDTIKSLLGTYNLLGDPSLNIAVDWPPPTIP